MMEKLEVALWLGIVQRSRMGDEEATDLLRQENELRAERNRPTVEEDMIAWADRADGKVEPAGQRDQTAGNPGRKTETSPEKAIPGNHYAVKNLDTMSLLDKKEKALAILDRLEEAIEHDRWIVNTARMTVENLEDYPSGEFQLTQFLKNPTLNKAYWNLIDAIDNRSDAELEK